MFKKWSICKSNNGFGKQPITRQLYLWKDSYPERKSILTSVGDPNTLNLDPDPDSGPDPDPGLYNQFWKKK